MSVQSVGPFSNFKTNFNTTKQTATDPQIAQDVAKDVSKNNKKTAAIIGGVAALAILGTGALVAIKRHKVPNEIKTALNNFEETNKAANALAQSAKKQADEVTEYAQRLFNEVSDLFKKGDEINLERAMKISSRFDGHIVSGHIDCTAKKSHNQMYEQTLFLWSVSVWLYSFPFYSDLFVPLSVVAGCSNSFFHISPHLPQLQSLIHLLVLQLLHTFQILYLSTSPVGVPDIFRHQTHYSY